MIVFLNGKFIDSKKAKISIFDHGFLYGDSVYETLRTYNSKVWNITAHLKRLQSSANFLGLKLPYSLNKTSDLVNRTVKLNKFKESRIRITLTRGENFYNFSTCKNPTLLIVVQKLIPESVKVYKEGVSVVTFKGQRDLPKAKTSSLLPMILAKRFAESKKAYESIFIDKKDFVLEGSVTNIFIIKDSVLITPKNNILIGTMREMILKIARKSGVKILERDFKIDQLYNANEVFITNAPKGIVPVVKVNNKKIKSGVPGEITKNLQGIFKDYL